MPYLKTLTINILLIQREKSVNLNRLEIGNRL